MSAGAVLAAPACGGCAYYVPSAGTPLGFCQRYPPTFTNAPGLWPQVHQTDWCGEFLLQGQPAPLVMHSVQAHAAGLTPIWTPANGKSFKLLGFVIMLTGNATVTAGTVVTATLYDGANAIPIAFDFFVPQTTANQWTPDNDTPWIDLDEGYLSAAVNNVLSINLSTALTVGNFRVFCIGTEQ